MKSYVIIGNSAAGTAAAEEIRKLDKDSSITIISDEKGPAYSRCLLTNYISGQINNKLIIYRNIDFYKEHKINLIDNTRAVKIDRDNNEVVLDSNSKIKYDKLLIAAGSAPKIPLVAQNKKGAVFGLRTITDAEKVISEIDSVKSAAVLGAGLIGIKIAHALYKKEKEVFMIARSPRILSQMMDTVSAEFLGEYVGGKINLLTGLDASEILYKNEKISGLKLSNDENIECQMVLVAKGVNSNIELAKDAGLPVHWGVIVDETMKSDDNIYAAGDAAESTDLLTGERDIKALWTTAVEQGRAAGKNMAGEKTVYNGAVSMNSVECFGIPCISSGNLKADYPEVFEYKNIEKLVLRRIFVKDNKIHGFITIGDIRFAGIFNNFLKEKIDISKIKSKFNSVSLNKSDLLKCLGHEQIISLMEKPDKGDI